MLLACFFCLLWKTTSTTHFLQNLLLVHHYELEMWKITGKWKKYQKSRDLFVSTTSCTNIPFDNYFCSTDYEILVRHTKLLSFVFQKIYESLRNIGNDGFSRFLKEYSEYSRSKIMDFKHEWKRIQKNPFMFPSTYKGRIDDKWNHTERLASSSLCSGVEYMFHRAIHFQWSKQRDLHIILPLPPTRTHPPNILERFSRIRQRFLPI